jgi:hypothetical protein
MRTLAIAAALLLAVLLAAAPPATAGGFVWGRPGFTFGYGYGRPRYWGAPWAGAYRPYVFPGYNYYYAPRPYYPPPVYYVPQPYYGGGPYWGDAYYRGAPCVGPYRSYRSYPHYDRVPLGRTFGTPSWSYR